MAAEYEFLYAHQKIALASAEGQVEELKRKVEQIENQVEMWQSLAKAPFPVVVQSYMDNEMRKARELGRKDAMRRARRSGLLVAIEKLEGMKQCPK